MRENISSKNVIIAQLVLVFAFFGLIFLLFLYHISATFEITKSLLTEEGSFEDFKDSLKVAYTLNSEIKHGFIDLNGLYVRMTGKRLHNGVIKLNNGMLGVVENKEEDNTRELRVEWIEGVSSFAQEIGIPFLYVQRPTKEDLKGELFPYGIDTEGNNNYNMVLKHLQNRNVDTLDLRPYISETKEQIEENFFKTDHHWNYEGAFYGTGILLERICEILDEEMDSSMLKEKNWERHILPGSFLGSSGRKVGKFFAGVDDLVWLTPVFDTSMSLAVPKHHRLTKGNFVETNIQEQYTKQLNYFKYNPYCLYIGGDYPLSQHRNANARFKKKLLIIKDSFVLPVEAFLSTVFSEIDVLDPRYYENCSINQYIFDTKPDIVIMIYSADMPSGVLINDEKVRCHSHANKTQLGSISVEAGVDDNNYYLIKSILKNGYDYKISFDAVSAGDGYLTDGVSIGLYNTTTATVEQSAVFDISYYMNTGKSMEAFFYIPENTDEYHIILYAGMAGQTKEVSATYHNVILSELRD